MRTRPHKWNALMNARYWSFRVALGKSWLNPTTELHQKWGEHKVIITYTTCRDGFWAISDFILHYVRCSRWVIGGHYLIMKEKEQLLTCTRRVAVVGHSVHAEFGSHKEQLRYWPHYYTVLPLHTSDGLVSALPSKEVTKIALRLKYQIERVIPCELDSNEITNPNSSVITKAVVQTTREAGGEEYRACVLYCLLVCLRWFKAQALIELWDSELYAGRALACEVIAKHM